jgi:hypothetical protein
MASRVFFSFHYQDVVDFRANVVRQHHLTKERGEAGFFDHSLWEEAKKQGSTALKRMINSGLDGSSATCVLIGSETYGRPWVRYEILKSMKRGNRLFGVHINSVKGRNQLTKPLGPNPFEYLAIRYSDSGITATMLEWTGSVWKEYEEIDSSASYQLKTAAAADRRGRTIQLHEFYRLYDWIANDGYKNFGGWVGG